MPLVAFLYSTTPYSRTKEVPYQVAIGRAPSLPVNLAIKDVDIPATATYLSDLLFFGGTFHPS